MRKTMLTAIAAAFITWGPCTIADDVVEADQEEGIAEFLAELVDDVVESFGPLIIIDG